MHGLAAPLAGLPCDRGKAGETGGLLGVHAAQFRHIGQQRQGGDLAQTGDAYEDIKAGFEVWRGGHQLVACGVDVQPWERHWSE